MAKTKSTRMWARTFDAIFPLTAAAAAVLLLLLGGCGDDGDDTDASSNDEATSVVEGEGTFSLAIYGEDFIEEEIPTEAFIDGWSVTFDHFLIVVQDVAIAQPGASPLTVEGGARVFDVAASSGGSGHALSSLTAPAGAYETLTYRIAPSAGATPENVGDAEAALVDGHAVYVAGAATKGDTTKTFVWTFDADKTYTNCAIASGDLSDGGEAAAQMTIHGDHLFYDDLVSEEPNVAFDLIASADADDDGAVSIEELRAVDITGESRYQVGSRTEITTLYGFIDAQVATLGHIDGEGHCD